MAELFKTIELKMVQGKIQATVPAGDDTIVVITTDIKEYTDTEGKNALDIKAPFVIVGEIDIDGNPA